VDWTEALITVGIVLGISLALWIVGRIARNRLPGQFGELAAQLIPVLIVGTVVVGGLIIIDPDQAQILLESTIRSVPRVMMALIVVIIARALGRILGLFVETALRPISAVMANRSRLIVSSVVLGIGVVIALQQIGISTDIILILVAALAFGTALTVALAVGLGSLPLARQVASGRHVQHRFVAGQRLRVGTAEGRIEAIHLASTTLVDEAGRRIEVPNDQFISGPVIVLDQVSAGTSGGSSSE
jgi:small-conductance mechanosensitive channel